MARQPAGAAWGTDGIARCGVASARPGAPSRVARWGRNIPAVLGMRLSRLRLVLPRYSKVVENTLKNGSVLRTNHFQISADGISLTGTQIVLICIIPIGESNAARTAGHADEGIVLFQNQKIPINREPRHAELVGEVLHRVMAAQIQYLDDLSAPLIRLHRVSLPLLCYEGILSPKPFNF